MVSCGRRRLMLALALLCVLVVLKLWLLAEPNPNASPVFVVTPRRGQGGRTHAASKELQTQTGMEVPPERLWHLDPKGGAPLVPFIEGMMSLAARAGATGVLLEWEDMFPFTSPLAELSAHNAYSLKDVARIMQAAKGAGLSVIHLVQSLGHMEYALKQQKWADLREGESPGEACPTNPGTARLVLEAVEQIMTAAPSPFLHIGADEVFTLGQCQRCRSKGVAPLQLYVDHVAQVARSAKARWDVKVLIWDDMLRHASSTLLHSLAGLVEPVVWAYGPDVTRMVPPYILRAYAAVFPRVWLAPAFKGATSPRSVMPNIARHAANTLAWVQEGQRMRRHAGLHVAGIIITGWSRYDHFAVLCELLPSSTPSLVLTMLTASRGFLTAATLRDTHTLLQCPPHVVLDPARDPQLWAARDCDFAGANLADLIHRYVTLRDNIKLVAREAEEVGAWFTPYNIRHNFSSPSRLREATRELPSLLSTLADLYAEVRAVLPQYHNPATVEEWIEQHLLPLNQTLSRFNRSFNALMKVKAWPRRPLGGKDPPPT